MSDNRQKADPDADIYYVGCRDCELSELVSDSEIPSPKREMMIEYHGSIEKALSEWDARSSALGIHDNHKQSEFRDFENGLRHRPYIESFSTNEDGEYPTGLKRWPLE